MNASLSSALALLVLPFWRPPVFCRPFTNRPRFVPELEGAMALSPSVETAAQLAPTRRGEQSRPSEAIKLAGGFRACLQSCDRKQALDGQNLIGATPGPIPMSASGLDCLASSPRS